MKYCFRKSLRKWPNNFQHISIKTQQTCVLGMWHRWYSACLAIKRLPVRSSAPLHIAMIAMCIAVVLWSQVLQPYILLYHNLQCVSSTITVWLSPFFLHTHLPTWSTKYSVWSRDIVITQFCAGGQKNSRCKYSKSHVSSQVELFSWMWNTRLKFFFQFSHCIGKVIYEITLSSPLFYFLMEGRIVKKQYIYIYIK